MKQNIIFYRIVVISTPLFVALLQIVADVSLASAELLLRMLTNQIKDVNQRQSDLWAVFRF